MIGVFIVSELADCPFLFSRTKQPPSERRCSSASTRPQSSTPPCNLLPADSPPSLCKSSTSPSHSLMAVPRYSESLYALFSLGGVFHLLSGSDAMAVLLFALSGSARSNGALNAGYFLFRALHRASAATLRKKPFFEHLVR